MRLLPVVPTFTREATLDSSVPLTTPIKTTDGKFIDHLLIPAKTEISISIANYDTTPKIWGSDSHEFNVDRFLKEDGPLDGGEVIPGSFGGLLVTFFLSFVLLCMRADYTIRQIKLLK